MLGSCSRRSLNIRHAIHMSSSVFHSGSILSALGCQDSGISKFEIAFFQRGVCNGGKEYDACGVCGGDGSMCTEISMTIPQTIASSQPTVWVIGNGLDDGWETLCELYDPESGDLVVNTTGMDSFHGDVFH